MANKEKPLVCPRCGKYPFKLAPHDCESDRGRGGAEFERKLRDWLADRLRDFGNALKSGADPEVTFSVKVRDLPRFTCQIRLIDLPGHYTREDTPIEIVIAGRSEDSSMSKDRA